MSASPWTLRRRLTVLFEEVGYKTLALAAVVAGSLLTLAQND